MATNNILDKLKSIFHATYFIPYVARCVLYLFQARECYETGYHHFIKKTPYSIIYRISVYDYPKQYNANST